MEKDIVYAKFSITIPRKKWLQSFSHRYPQVKLLILSKYLIDETHGNILFEIAGFEVPTFASELMKIDVDAHVLQQDNMHALLSVKMKDPWILDALVRTEILLIYPIAVQNGKLMMETFTDRTKIDLFFSELESKKIKFDIQRIGSYFEKPLLTKKQYEVLTEAYDQGFYEIPRGIDRTTLAVNLGVSKAAISENLRRIHARLVKKYLTTPRK